MKHLISLSLKYIRRQKFRSVLTFLCITLSVFILNTFSAYLSSIICTVKNEEIANSGSWEVNLSNVVRDTKKIKESIEVIENHVAVSDYLATYLIGLHTEYDRDEEGRVSFFEINLDNGENVRVKYLNYTGLSGNRKLSPDSFYGTSLDGQEKIAISGNEIYAPSWLRNYGYKEGDTITFSVTPFSGVLDENSSQAQQTLERLKKQSEAENGVYFVSDSGEEEVEPASILVSGPLLRYMQEDFELSEIELSDIREGISTEEYSCKIIGFRNTSEDSFSFLSGTSFPMEFNKLYKDNSGSIADLSYLEEPVVYARINDNADFDDGLLMLYEDLGFDKSTFYNYFFDGSEDMHTKLLAIEFKGSYVIVTLLPYIIAVLFLTLLVWAISRFVIDNAFEISVQERSTQFAALRIMGASKNQLLALVLTEGIFYSITALPIGTFLAFWLCNSVFVSIRNVGFVNFEFDANPVITIIGILICAAAIFVSAYTSAMWAAKKLSPAEALNYGKPSKKKKASSGKKSRINRSSKGFIVRYTLKNIFRTKKRFLISSIAMALGVIMFTLCVFIGLYTGKELKEFTENDYDNYDFMVMASGEYTEKAQKEIASSDVFSDCRIYCRAYRAWEGESEKIFNRFVPYDMAFSISHVPITTIEKEEYDSFVAPLANMTYDEFTASETGLVLVSPYGDEPYITEDSTPVYEDYYRSASTIGFEENPSITFFEGGSIELSGAVCTQMNVNDYPCIIVPLENAEKMLSSEDFGYNVYIRTTVYGSENYLEAEKIMTDFANYTGDILINNYMVCTGLYEFIGAIIKAVLVFLVSIWLVGILSMVNSINTSVLNRQPELLMLRAVGMSKRQLYGTVMLESVLFSAFSAIIGTLISVGFYSFMVKVLWGDDGFRITGSIITVVLISIAVNVIIAVLAAMPGLHSLSKRMKHRNI